MLCVALNDFTYMLIPLNSTCVFGNKKVIRKQLEPQSKPQTAPTATTAEAPQDLLRSSVQQCQTAAVNQRNVC